MRKLSKIALLLSLLTVIAVDANAAPYVSPKGYQYQPPVGWIPGVPSGSIDSLYAAKSTTEPPPSVTIAVVRIPDTVTGDPLAATRDTVIAEEKRLPSYTLISKTPTTVSGLAASEVFTTFKPSASAPLMKVHHIFVVNNKICYVVTGAAQQSQYDTYKKDLDASLASFTFDIVPSGPFISPEGFTVTPPKNWATKTGADIIGVYFVEQNAADFAANVSVKTQAIDPAATIDDIYKGRAELIGGITAGMTDTKVINQQMSSVAGEKSALIEVSFVAPKVPMRLWLRQLYVVHSQKLYIITLVAKESDRALDLQVFNTMLASLSWSATAPVPPSGSPGAVQTDR